MTDATVPGTSALRPLVRLVALGLATAAAFAFASPARADVPAVSDPDVAAQQLVDRYAPVVVIRRHDTPCSSDGEPYVPMTVDALLGNPEVALRQVGNGDQV